MCGRFTRKMTWKQIHDLYEITNTADTGRNDPARYNIAPTQQVSFAVEIDGERHVKDGQWWMVPSWAKEDSRKFPTFNAREETVHEKPTFRSSFKSKRCLVPADGYYEWVKNVDDGKKDPYYITLPEHKPFCFAGLWEHNKTLDITSFTIITLPAKPATIDIHARIPIILEPSAFDQWLDAETPVDDCCELLERNLGDDLEYCRVGREVGAVKAEGPQLIEPWKSDMLF